MWCLGQRFNSCNVETDIILLKHARDGLDLQSESRYELEREKGDAERGREREYRRERQREGVGGASNEVLS